MKFKIDFSEYANQQLDELEKRKDLKHINKKVLRTLGYMETNLKHPSLNTHKYDEIEGPNGEDVFESYVENNTPGAYRVFWYYGPKRNVITVLEITAHP